MELDADDAFQNYREPHEEEDEGGGDNDEAYIQHDFRESPRQKRGLERPTRIFDEPPQRPGAPEFDTPLDHESRSVRRRLATLSIHDRNEQRSAASSSSSSTPSDIRNFPAASSRTKSLGTRLPYERIDLDTAKEYREWEAALELYKTSPRGISPRSYSSDGPVSGLVINESDELRDARAHFDISRPRAYSNNSTLDEEEETLRRAHLADVQALGGKGMALTLQALLRTRSAAADDECTTNSCSSGNSNSNSNSNSTSTSASTTSSRKGSSNRHAPHVSSPLRHSPRFSHQHNPPLAMTKKILLADDRPEIHFFVKMILSDEYQVETVDDGPEVLETLLEDEEDFDLLLLDIYMDEMNGDEVVVKLREAEQTAAMPILALTGDGDEDSEVKRLMSLGFDGVVCKPIDPEDPSKLKDPIRALLDKNNAGNQLDGLGDALMASLGNVANSADAKQLEQEQMMDHEPANAASSSSASSSSKPGQQMASMDMSTIIGAIRDKFKGDLARDVAALRDKLDAGDFVGIRKLAHTLGGIGGHLHSSNIRTLCKSLKDAAAEEDASACEALIGDLHTIVQQEQVDADDTDDVDGDDMVTEEYANTIGFGSVDFSNLDMGNVEAGTPASPVNDEEAQLRPAILLMKARFIEDVKHDTDLIVNALASDPVDFDTIYKRAHVMKGVGKMLGFDQVTTISAVIRNQAADQNATLVEQAVASLQDFLEGLQVDEEANLFAHINDKLSASLLDNDEHGNMSAVDSQQAEMQLMMGAMKLQFLGNLEVGLGTMSAAIEDEGNEDWDAVFQEAHALKGIGGSLGYPVLTEIMDQLKSQARGHNRQAALTLLNEINIWLNANVEDGSDDSDDSDSD